MAFVSPLQFTSHRRSSLGIRVCNGKPLVFHEPKRRARQYRSPIIATESFVSDEQRQNTSVLERYFHTFTWRGYSINYKVEGPETDASPILIVHGFGASVNHWRKNIPSLVDTGKLRVYAIDLLGFGASEKPSPEKVTYGLELWQHLVCDFINAQDEKQKWSLIGNSIGSLICLMSAMELGTDKVQSCALINCAGGLTSFRYSELNAFQRSLLWSFNTILFNSITGPALFRNFRRRENVAGVLKQIYLDRSAITEELIDILCDPAMDMGACDVFLAVLNADAGPAPEELLPNLTWCPMLVIWGDKDPWTPLEQGFHPGIKFPEYHPGIDLQIIPGAGHCVHDEVPEAVNNLLTKFLVPASNNSS